MPFMKSNRDQVVSTTAGHTISFVENEPKWVPEIDLVVQNCVQRGCVECADPNAAKPKPVEVQEPAKKPSPAIQRARTKANPKAEEKAS